MKSKLIYLSVLIICISVTASAYAEQGNLTQIGMLYPYLAGGIKPDVNKDTDHFLPMYGFSLSPDQTEIAILDSRGLWRMPVDGKEGVLLVPSDKKTKDASRFDGSRITRKCVAWSPDGQKIAFVLERYHTAPSLLKVYDLKTHKLCEMDHSTGFSGFAWSPDGKKLCWIRSNIEYRYKDISKKTDNSPSIKNMTDGKLIMGDSSGNDESHTIMELPTELLNTIHLDDWKGNCIVLTNGEPSKQIWLIASDGEILSKIDRAILRGKNRLIGSFPIVLSHDGSRFAYIGGGCIYVYDITHRRTSIMASGYAPSVIAWSADEKEMAFTGYDYETLNPKEIPVYDFYSIHPDTGIQHIADGIPDIRVIQCMKDKRILCITDFGNLYIVKY